MIDRSGLRRTNQFDAALKFALLFALPPLFAIWLGLSIAGSVIVGVGYGFFAPWVSTFEAFRQDDGEWKKYLHCIVVRVTIFHNSFIHVVYSIDCNF